MAKNRISGYSLEQRLIVADTLINGRDYDTVREQLAKAGIAEDELPSDHSLRTYQDSMEFHTLRRDRFEAAGLIQRAGALRGSLAARITLIQDRGVRMLEDWMDRGLLEPGELRWFLGFTLKYQQLELARERLAHQSGRAAPVEPPAQPFIAAADFIQLVGQAVEKQHADADADADTGLGAGAATEEKRESLRKSEDSQVSDAAQLARAQRLHDELNAHLHATSHQPGRGEENAGKVRISEDNAASAVRAAFLANRPPVLDALAMSLGRE